MRISRRLFVILLKKRVGDLGALRRYISFLRNDERAKTLL